MRRRQFAKAIRIRQEVVKRLEAIRPAPRWRVDHTNDRILESARLESRRTPLFRALLERHSHATGGPADAEQLIDEADGIVRGEWRVFDRTLALGADAPKWRSHPVSEVTTPLTHFSRLYYTGDAVGGDIKYLWEINRHQQLMRLAQAFYLTRNETYAVRAVSLLEDWIAHNPPGRGVNWLSALEVSFRSIVWCWVWHLTAESDAWSNARVHRMLWVLTHAGRYLERYDSIHHSPNTHLTGEALGLLYIGHCFPQLRMSTRWAARGLEILTSETPHQFLDDGFHFERATGYHRYNVEFYLHALAIARATQDASWQTSIAAFEAPLRKALTASQLLRRPDGDWPVIGDEDGGVAVHLWSGSSRDQSPLLALGSALLHDEQFAAGMSERDASAAWWFGCDAPAMNRNASVTVASGVTAAAALSDAGYFVARDTIDGDEWYCLVDAGPHGGNATGHAHTDIGHVELAIGANTIICDPGCAVYASDVLRREFYRSLSAHATVVVDGNQLAESRGPFGWRTCAPTPTVEHRNTDAMWTLRLRYSVSEVEPITHERHVVLIRGVGLFVVDFINAHSRHHLRWRWPFADRIDSDARELMTGAIPLHGARVAWHASQSTLAASMVASRRSPTYGEELACSALELTTMCEQWPMSVVTAFLPASAPSLRVHCEAQVVTITSPSGERCMVGDGRLATLTSMTEDDAGVIPREHPERGALS